ncbi:restriction endonuclease subunit S [Polynucleobacter sp.]|uniref:restriction endonuclease subunit S n=1 Tax=Polynucleobacter sp. TaxID=2029855 RepID=UPI00272B6D56|nr:restriction endonuclease subunit S [Polynucleobacter sp.]
MRRRNEGIVSRGFLLGRNILVKNYSQLQIGDFVISKRQVVHGASGIVPAKLNKAIVSNEYLVAVENSDISTEFLAALSSLPKMKRKFFLSSYGVDIEKLFFDVEDWKGRFITIPKLGEQLKISAYLKELDQLIHLHLLEREKLVTLKKAMLQKMFPRNGVTKPEIRFKGFTEDWKKKKLGNISDSFSGGTPSVANHFFYGGNISFIRSGEINSKSTELTITELGLQNSAAKLVNKGDILYALYGATSGEVGISQVNGAINQAVLCIKPHSGNNSQFLSVWLRSQKTAIIGTYLQGGQGNLSGSIIKLLEVDLPGAIEQQKIGNYFEKLDRLIALHVTRLEKIKQIKLACMEKMFV